MGEPMTHRFVWRNGPIGGNTKRAALCGRECRLLVVGRLNSVLVEWADGTRDVTDRQGLRRLHPRLSGGTTGRDE